jgi:hypothetical protein
VHAAVVHAAGYTEAALRVLQSSACCADH